MFKSKKSKQKHLRSNSETRSSIPNDYESIYSPTLSRNNNMTLDENQVRLLTNWLEKLNKEKLIIITDQNDIVVMPEGKNDQTQQIFVNCNHIDDYIERRINKSHIISMFDLAQILLLFGYVTESSGQLSFVAETIASDSNELKWLRSIIQDARPNSKSNETHVKLFDGENTQVLSIPYEFMTPTNNIQIVANYLFRNGHVRYDVDTGTYAYRYVEPDSLLDDKIKSPERIRQHQFLSFHIREIHIDKRNRSVQLEFRYEPEHELILPTHWYDQLFEHNFDRDYIIDVLLANGGVINRNTFVFMGHTYSLQGESNINKINSTSMPSLSSNYFKTVNLSLKDKTDLIGQYIDLIIEMDGVKQDKTNQLLVLENDADGRKLYFTSEHSLFIKQNQFQRQHVIQILVKYSQIKQDQLDKLFLNYNNQYIRLPSSITSSYSQNPNNRIYSSDQRMPPTIQQMFSSNTRSGSNSEQDFVKRYDYIIDYMCRHGFVTWDKTSNVIKLHFADQNLLLPINHLRSIINPRILSSSSSLKDGVLPFTSQQLSQWLRNNSYITRKQLITS